MESREVKDEITLKDLIFKVKEWWKYLLNKWVYILALGLLGGTAGFLYAYFQKPVYIATTTFVLETGETGGGLGQYAGLASLVGVDLGDRGGGIFQGDNIIELYKSRKMLQKTLLTPVTINGKRQTLMERYVILNKLRKDWGNKPLLLHINFGSYSNKPNSTPNSNKIDRLRDSILGKTIENINKNYLSVSKPDKKLSIIHVDLKSTDEQFSKEFNEELVKNVNEFYVETKTKKSLENVTILQRKVDSVRAVMNGAIYSAAAVLDATPNVNPTRQLQRSVPTQKAQFSAEANKAILTNLIQSLELGKITLLKETPLIQTVDTPIYPLKIEKVSKSKGLILGGIIFGFFTCLYFILRRLYMFTISEETI